MQIPLRKRDGAKITVQKRELIEIGYITIIQLSLNYHLLLFQQTSD